MTDPTISLVPELVAARWRRNLAAELTRLLGYIAQGSVLIGAPVIDGVESELANPYGMAIVLIGPDGALVTTKGLRYEHDQRRVEDALHDALDPESATRRVVWERERQAELDAYNALPFPCVRGGRCQDRFASDRGRAGHYRAADRRAARGQDWSHEPVPERKPVPRLALRVMESADSGTDSGSIGPAEPPDRAQNG